MSLLIWHIPHSVDSWLTFLPRVQSPGGVLLIWHFSSPHLAKVTLPRDPPALHTPAQRFCYSARDVLQGAGPWFVIGFLFSPLGYASNDMPVKAKRSTYNYSLPITVKKPGTLCPQKGWLALLFLCSPHPHSQNWSFISGLFLADACLPVGRHPVKMSLIMTVSFFVFQ